MTMVQSRDWRSLFFKAPQHRSLSLDKAVLFIDTAHF